MFNIFSGCTNLTSITIPASVTNIELNPFQHCSGLISINVEAGNTKYDSRNNCNGIIETATNTLITGCQNTTIPNSVTTIGHFAFYNCSGLTSITIPNSVTRIGIAAFGNCSGLTSITIPNSVKDIYGSSFAGCSLASINVEAGNTVYDSRDNCNAIIATKSNALIVGCKNTTIPNSVTTIGMGAFDLCSGLTSITIPISVTNIKEYAFEGCGLTSIKVEAGNIIYDSRNNCNGIIETATNTLITGCQNTTIPNSVTTIGNSAFSWCLGLTSITIPNSVTRIGTSAFTGCRNLTSITIPNCLTSIGNSAFYNCSSLTSIMIPNGVTSIGNSAFEGCI